MPELAKRHQVTTGLPTLQSEAGMLILDQDGQTALLSEALKVFFMDTTVNNRGRR